MKNKFVFLILMMVIFGCKENHETTKMDEDTFLKNLESAPVVIVPSSELPEWLNMWIDNASKDFVGKTWGSVVMAEVHRGIWRDRTVYQATSGYSSAKFNPFYENGERIIFHDTKEYDNFISTSQKWELIFQISDGIVIVGELARGK